MTFFASCKIIIIKVGSSLLVDEANHVRGEWLATLASDIALLKNAGKQVIVVTSGAVALGRHPLGYGTRALELEEKQAAAACGQITLISAWAQAMAAHQLFPAQMLLTADDSIDRRRYLNARNTLSTLLENAHAVPVVNENDTVATAEIRFGDNDRLAARVAQMAGADMLVLFSDIDGLYSADPSKVSDAQFIPVIKEISADIEAMAGGVASSVGSGGMITKIEAAKIATNAGCHMIIARGHSLHPLKVLGDGGKHTHFVAHGSPMSARKRWIAGSIHPAGSIVVDDGAAQALKSGKSLLPAGACAIEGSFDRGDAVLIKDKSGAILGKGLSAYDSADAKRILGKKTTEIEQILGVNRRGALIHRDDMALSN